MTSPSILSAATPLPPFARMAFQVANAVLEWELRRTTRRDLARLDPHMLDDVGLTMRDARDEVRRPFWR